MQAINFNPHHNAKTPSTEIHPRLPSLLLKKPHPPTLKRPLHRPIHLCIPPQRLPPRVLIHLRQPRVLPLRRVLLPDRLQVRHHARLHEESVAIVFERDAPRHVQPVDRGYRGRRVQGHERAEVAASGGGGLVGYGLVVGDGRGWFGGTHKCKT